MATSHHNMRTMLSPSPLSNVSSLLFPTQQQQQQQTRNKSMTKAKRRKRDKIIEREQRVARGLPAKPLPPKYIDKETPVINALSREDRDAESTSFDVSASQEMKTKIETQAEMEESIRFQFNGLVMSDRVRKLLDLTNGNQREVVSSQKRRGMELFQLREGDTGSSAVQVVALTTRIQQIQTHLAQHKKDKSGKRGLDALYVRRRKVLDYMERKDFESYRKVVKSLGLVR
jgi:small subunit ribosomal protein S15